MHPYNDAQREVEGKLHLWVASAYPVWQEIDVKAPDVMEQATACVSACMDVLMKRSQAQGFTADLLPSGQSSSLRIKVYTLLNNNTDMRSLGASYHTGCSQILTIGCSEVEVSALQGDATT